MEPRQKDFFERLERVGELEVRHRVTTGQYTGPHKLWAAKWIAEIDQRRSEEAERRSDASNAEHLRIARSEKNAAWVAAISAIAAIIISIIALYLSWLGLDPVQKANLLRF